MKTFSNASIKTLLLALLAACTLSLHADKVKFVSGGLYQIRTVCRTDGCIHAIELHRTGHHIQH